MAVGFAAWMRGANCIVKLHGPATIGLILFPVVFFSNCCEKEEDLLLPNIAVSGRITNNSGYAGMIIVEIDYNMRDIANTEGQYSIGIHKDFYIDSLYAWVDRDGNDIYTQGEPFGFYHSSAEPDSAKAIHARGTDITMIDFSIP